MARAPVLAAGGIVLRQAKPPLIAVVRLRKGNEWVLPKGKLDDGETPRDAAMREVLEETGHDVSVHEFLGTLAYDAGGRSKIVHYWRMDAGGKPTRDLMHDVSAVDWLPLKAAVERLSRDHERAFLANVGPLALDAAAHGKRSRETRRSEETRAVVPVKRRRRRTVTPKPSPALSPSVAPLPEVAVPAIEPIQSGLPEHQAIGSGPSDRWALPEMAGSTPETFSAVSASVDHAPRDHASRDSLPSQNAAIENKQQSPRVDILGRVRAWLRRAA